MRDIEDQANSSLAAVSLNWLLLIPILGLALWTEVVSLTLLGSDPPSN